MQGARRAVVVLASLVSSAALLVQSVPVMAGVPAFSSQHRVGFASGDDWEPSIAADRYDHEYVLYKHYDVPGGGTCAGCDVHLLVQRSSDGGRTWNAPRPIAPVAVDGGQYDPQIVVDPVDGRTLWASFLQNANSVIDVVTSTDFGKTWSAPATVSGALPPGLDKDTLVVRGRTVAVAYTDATGNTFASISHDGGEHWAVEPITPQEPNFDFSLSAGGGIDSHGNLFFAWNSFDAAHSTNGDGPVTLWITKSSDGGVHWKRVVIDASGAPPPCDACGYAYLSAQMTMRMGAGDIIYLLWNGTVDRTDFASERIFFSRSLDDGATFSPRREVSTAPVGVEHSFPAIAVGEDRGDVRIAWMDTRRGAWNVFYRESQDGGRRFNPTIQVSTPVAGYPYLSPTGFLSPYGDYFQMTVDGHDRTQMAFGEGPSYAGPGNIWVAHQLGDGEDSTGDAETTMRASSASTPSVSTSSGLTSSSSMSSRLAEK
jgi:hypothetical protein